MLIMCGGVFYVFVFYIFVFSKATGVEVIIFFGPVYFLLVVLATMSPEKENREKLGLISPSECRCCPESDPSITAVGQM